MHALSASTSRACVGSARASRSVVSAPLRISGARRVVVRAEPTAASEGPDYGAQATEAFNKAVAYVQTVWDDTADAEKPAIVAILLAVTVGQIAIGATMDTIDRLPFFGDLFELIGVAVVATYVYKYVTDPSERASAKATVDNLITSVTGK